MRRYDVALWRWWPSLFPDWCEMSEAPSAFVAVEVVRRRHGCITVQHAAACARNGLVVNRCFGVCLTPWGRVAPRAAGSPWGAADTPGLPFEREPSIPRS